MSLTNYVVLYDHVDTQHEGHLSDLPMAFRCKAIDAEHAEELAKAGHPERIILWVEETDLIFEAVGEWRRSCNFGEDPFNDVLWECSHCGRVYTDGTQKCTSDDCPSKVPESQPCWLYDRSTNTFFRVPLHGENPPDSSLADYELQALVMALTGLVPVNDRHIMCAELALSKQRWRLQAATNKSALIDDMSSEQKMYADRVEAWERIIHKLTAMKEAQ